MDPAAPVAPAAAAAAAASGPALSLSVISALAQAPLALSGLVSPSPPLSSGHKIHGTERYVVLGLWQPELRLGGFFGKGRKM